MKLRLSSLALCALAAGCSMSSGGVERGVIPSPSQTVNTKISSAGKDIKHIVIIVQENRSFENVFAGFPGADAPMYGYTHTGSKVTLQPIPYEPREIAHEYATTVLDIDGGKMDGFDENFVSGSTGLYTYSYLERNLVKPYWKMAQQYVLADHMFPTIFGPSFTAHLALIASQANVASDASEINNPLNQPWGCDAPSGTTTDLLYNTGHVTIDGPFPCFTQFRTMADTLDAAGVSWDYYAPTFKGPNQNLGGFVWSTFDAISNVRYGSDWKKRIVSPPSRILTDAMHNKLPQVAWVMPDWEWSDHPQAGTPYGPSWVASIVNAIGKSQAWRSTAIVVLWDDWGGLYDNAPPPARDYRGPGIRVGCIIISPYVKPHVSHTSYEFGSILKFVEEVFHLPQLGSQAAGYTDSGTASIVDSFNFKQKPRGFKEIPAPYPPSFFLNAAPSLRPPDDE